MGPREPQTVGLATEIFRHSLIQGLLLMLAACVVGGAYLMPLFPAHDVVPSALAANEESQAITSQFLREQLLRANTLFQARNWAEAGQAYREVTEEFPSVGLAWHRLGYALHVQGNLEEAIPCHQEAAQFRNFRAVSLYNLCCAHALKKEISTALRFLRQAVDAGFRGLDYLETDKDLDTLRAEPEFRKLYDEVQRYRSQTVQFSDDWGMEGEATSLPCMCFN